MRWARFQRLYALRNCGRPFRPGAPTAQSGNYRLTELQAALLLAQMDDLEERVNHRDENAQRLNERLAELPGIRPMKRYLQVTRQSYYAFTFRYDAAAWDSIAGHVFRKALAAETGLGVGSTYELLNHCSLYQPHTKRRHRLNDDYWRAIAPTRFALPVCEKAYADEAVVIGHSFLLAGHADMDEVAQAVEKLYEHRDELKMVA